MLHSASLTDPTVAYSPYNPYASPNLDHGHLLHNGHPCSPGSLSPANSAAVAALTAAVAASAGIPPNVKDSQWLTLEVCRQYQRNQCSRDENECKFAHPPTHVDVQNGRVVCCYDSIKGKCQRRDPPCKYLHPPQHLREQLMQNGRNNMIFRNMQLQLFQQQLLAQSTGMLPYACNSAGSGSATMTGTGSPNSIIYPGPGPLTLGNPNGSNTYSFLNMGFAPYLTALAGSHLNGTSGYPEIIHSEAGNNLSGKRSITESSKSSGLYLPRSNGGAHHSNGDGKLVVDVQETPATCVMVVNGNANVDSIKEVNGTSQHTVPVTIRSTTGNTMAPATLYAIQTATAAPPVPPPPPQPPQGASLLNLPVSHHQPQTIAPLSAASLAAMVNGSMAGAQLAPGHFSALAEHTAYFQPTYHIEIPPYPYQ